jgi:HSP20 family molecular chaperone IbpA
MKASLVNNRCARLLATSLALSAGILTITNNLATAQETNQTGTNSFSEKAKSWQEKMSDAFRDTWRGLGTDKNAKSMTESSLATASVDLREQEDSYVVRMNLPDRNLDKVQISLDQNILKIEAPADGKAASYQQAITLSGIAPEAKPQIERKAKDNLIVVTVPKAAAGNPSTQAPVVVRPSVQDPWDQDVMRQMWLMQRQMDRIFNEAFAEFHSMPDFQRYFNQPRFGSSVDLQEQGDKYVVRAYLPERSMENVKVTVENQTLKIEAKAEKAKSDQGSQLSEKAYYSQFLTLPGSVQSDKMAVDRKEGMLVITLPKA